MIYQGIFNRLPAKLAFPQLGLWASQATLIALTFLLFSPAFSWMFDAFTSQEHRFQLIGVMMLVAYLIYKQVENHTAIHWQLTLQLRTTPIVLYVISSLAFVLNEYFLDIHIISATFSVLAFYALYGLFTSQTSWIKGFVPTLLLIVLLPFGDYLNVYLGFPLRLFSAYVTADTLTALGYPSMSSETIIVLENRYSNVDLSCSGIKGIWSGLAFFVLLSMIENKSIGPGWLWRLALFLLALIGANILRITILVLLGSQFSYIEFADLIHEMLGIIGFTLACLIGWGLLLTQKNTITPGLPKNKISTTVNRSQLTLLVLIISIGILNLVYTPMSKANTITVDTTLDLPDNWSPRLVDLSLEENEFFNRNQAHANKYSLQLVNNLDASLIAVHSSYWKGQHDPKNCLIAQGYKITKDTSLRLSTTESVRYMNLSRQNEKYIAVYWFQNATTTTDDYSKRIYTSIFDRNNPWVLASLLVKKPEYSHLDIRSIIKPVRTSIHNKIIQATKP